MRKRSKTWIVIVAVIAFATAVCCPPHPRHRVFLVVSSFFIGLSIHGNLNCMGYRYEYPAQCGYRAMIPKLSAKLGALSDDRRFFRV
ncbi:hypothetical protein BJ138DRAFT_1159389, partial [Hygrophoropsis aurantiaca]